MEELENLAVGHPPICTNCKYYKKPSLGEAYGRCSIICDVANGHLFRCNDIRYYGPCGVEGKYFKQKPQPKKGFWKSLWEALKAHPLDPIIETAERARHDH